MPSRFGGPRPRKLWTEDEDRMLEVYYPEHGENWMGWREVLPDRSHWSIGTRAQRLGLRVKNPDRSRSGRKPVGTVQRPKRGPVEHEYRVERTQDPYEKRVLCWMEEGKTPSEIDKEMKWFPGTTSAILVERWIRMGEQQGLHPTRGSSCT